MKIVDISLSLDNKTIAHPKEITFAVEPHRTLEKDGVATSKITLGSHFGTHIDVPKHFFEGGKAVDQTDLRKCFGPCQVIEVQENTSIIEETSLEGRITSERLLFKTKNSNLLNKPFTKDFTSLGISAAEYLIEQGVVLVGIDYTGIEASGAPGHPVHKKLLEKEIVIVEGLDLTDVDAGDYELIVLPLKLKDLDGSPARAILIKN